MIVFVKIKSLRPNRFTGALSVLQVTDGIMPDFNRLRYPFGSPGVANVPADRRGTSLDPRAELCLLIGRPLYGEPNYTVITLDNWSIVSRRHFRPVPLTQEIIDIIKRHQGIVNPEAALPEPIRGANADAEVDEDLADWELAQRHQAQLQIPPPVEDGNPVVASDAVVVPESSTQQPRSVAASSPAAPIEVRSISSPAKASQVSAASAPEPVLEHAVPAPVEEYTYHSPKKPRAPKKLSAVAAKIEEIKARAAGQSNLAFRVEEVTSHVEGESHMATELMVESYPKHANKVGSNMSFRKAIKKHSQVAEESGFKEIQQIVLKDMMEPVKQEDLSADMIAKIIRSHTFFKEKFLRSGELEKLKARLVAGGNLVSTEELGNISSPTVKLETVMLLHALAAQFGWGITIMDVPGAYLNTRLPKDQQIPMRLGPEEVEVLLKIKPEWSTYRRRDGSMLVMLRGGLYGLPQSAKLWYDEVSSKLKGFGYVASESDQCCFIKFDKNGKRSIVALYVDDFAHWYEDSRFDDKLIAVLEEHYGKLTVSKGDSGIYVGVEFDYNRQDRSVVLSMRKYLSKVLKDFNVQKGSPTPTSHDFMTLDESSPRVDSKRFASCVMTLFYLALRIRKDILFPITVLAMRIVDAREADLKKFTKLLRYLHETQHYVNVLRTRGTRLIFSIDASYAIHHNSRSHSGFHLTLGGDEPLELGYGGPIFCRSTVQKLVANSSFEAEVNAVHQNISYVSPLRMFMSELNFDQEQPSLLLQDNQATIHTFVNGPSLNSRAAHVRMRINNVKEYQDGGELEVRYDESGNMTSDPLTKCKSAVADAYCLQRLLNNYV